MKHLGWAALALAVAVGMPQAGAVDIDPFVRKDRFEDIKLSPNGDYYAATVPLEDRTVLAIIRRSDNKMTGSFRLGEHSHVSGMVWVNPTRVLISVAEKFGSLDRPQSTGELYAINADGTQSDILIGQRVRGAGPGTKIQPKKVEQIAAFLTDDLPQDANNVIVTTMPFSGDPYTRAEKLDVYSGRRALLARAPVRNAGFSTDNAGAVRFARGHDVDNESKLYYRNANGTWDLISDTSSTGLDEIPIGFSADNRTAYLQVEKETGPDAIVALDLATRARTEVLRDASADPARIIYRRGTSIPVGAFFASGRTRTAFFDPESPEARLYRSLEAAFPGSAVHVTSQTDDGRLALVLVGSDRNPGDFFVFDTVSKKADYLLSRADWFDPEAMAAMRPIELQARDGLALHGYVTLPKGSAGKNLPMVVMPHGGPYGEQDTWGFDGDVQMLARAGYAVLQLNFRGSGGYGQAFTHAGARQWGGTMQDDLTDATRWAIAQGIADPSRICIFGASYGGYASLMGVAKEPALYRCAVGYVGVYDLPTMHTDGDIQQRGSGETYIRQWIGERNALGPVSPNRLADRIKVPVFLAAGGEDERAPIQHSRMMEQALRKAGVPVETLYFPTEGHGFFQPGHRSEFYSRLLAFLARNLGGEGPTTAAQPPAGSARNAR